VAGVLGVVPGVMGLLQATEGLKLLLDIGDSLAGRLLIYDALDGSFSELQLRRDPHCPVCGDGALGVLPDDGVFRLPTMPLTTTEVHP
jgi:molybdopterin/thiamine biosynthesis adenylyltransferase